MKQVVATLAAIIMLSGSAADARVRLRPAPPRPKLHLPPPAGGSYFLGPGSSHHGGHYRNPVNGPHYVKS